MKCWIIGGLCSGVFGVAGLEWFETPLRSVEWQARPFTPGQVRLLEGPFRLAQEMDARWLLRLEPDRLLAPYRREAGLPLKAPAYGGWESQRISGHSLGHYLSACARLYQALGDRQFKQRVDYIVDELALCQGAREDGFIGGMPESRRVFAEIARGEIRSSGFDLNGSWVPWYNLHKLFAGLLDAHAYCTNDQALQIAARLGDWVDTVTRNLTETQWQRMLACEHGGMNEVLAELAARTGKPVYLDLARKFYHQAILDPLAEGRDELNGKHANTQIPKAIGAARIFELTRDAKYANVASNFFHIVVNHHTYANGGNSLGEHFGPPGRLNDRLGPATAETCNTYNMLKLARALYRWRPDAALGDYYERALWNHILASQHPENGQVLYFLPLNFGGRKTFMDDHAFTCCSGTGMENHARYNENIYFHSDSTLWIDQFIASELHWPAKGLRVRMQTRFPEEPEVRLQFRADAPVRLAVHIRHPFWATNGFNLELNGLPIPVLSRPGGYARLEREWQPDDVLRVHLPLTLRLESMPDNPRRVAIFYGPILLAGQLHTWRAEDPLPVLVTEDQPVDQWIQPAWGQPLVFRTVRVGRPRDLFLKPFYATYDVRHMVYWDLFTEAEWEKRRAAYEAEQVRLRELEARTVDRFDIGEMQPERDHNLRGQNTGPGEFNGRKFRHAWDGGWFAFDVAVLPDAPTDLVVTYWGSETGNRTFDILVDGERIDTTRLHMDRPNEFWDKVYPLPERLTRGKQRVEVRFQAHPGNFAGGVFGVRVVRR
ncbi:MAG: glycoside hydrolase family 127 protein [Verrucomicrobiota bacterium]|nr:glycoside hydrolase family 127 protein [Limisphaera sp.]MDW8382083.1 glycoside hydrolase family 127 protein [Verrucomicrobiota bacterium]